ncbi:polyribonucleotide 5'-hydroxyl-kinase Clp1-like [Argiope bruennichi]|uniref:Polyribonucleotide 5'-hydroxyl-kinase Clp1 like protein n=1 Tax=Argiope bruennichi TaxID=94029 RepID=A0A8T0E0M6_ARGBR|nr:polyribonucleotide 5'-hydroxyl-kinase Clp1-like [Argiope bruennichi]KAF8763501.1 Polyribonucleotide 5'-hydroxyl-kinase Clp1 like protein [Argiope bruennichi]
MSENRYNKQTFNREVRSELRLQARNSAANSKSSFELKPENELRIVVGKNSDVKIELSSGLAEIYGSEMELNKKYFLSPNSFIAVFTWHGCVIKLSGKPEDAYIITNTQMILNVVLHASLEEHRLQAVAENKKGPVIFIVGPNDVNRNALCRLLLNYAVRLGRCPLFIDLDVGQNSISLPSTIGILTVKKPSDIVSGFDDHAVQVYQYGYRSPWQKMRLYSLLVQRLSQIIQSRLRRANQNVRTSGVIINGCDWSKSEILHHGYAAITLVAMNFEIDILCVLQEEPLYLQLKKDMPSRVNVIFIPKMEGDVERNRYEKSEDREACIRKYFYGPINQVQPFTFEIKYSDIKVFKVQARPINRYSYALDDIKQDDLELMPVLLSPKLIDQILGLSSADDEHEDIIYMPVIGFICITGVDIARNRIRVLSPQPSPLKKKIFLLGETRIKKCH